MKHLLGIDLGTSSVKIMLAAVDGSARHAAEQEVALETPQPDWAEQEPEAWWRATVVAVRRCLAQAGDDPAVVTAIGLSGQMHGAVLLDSAQRPLRPAIIWADGRSGAECKQIVERVGRETLARTAGSGVFPGFMLPSLLWVRKHEPDLWARVAQVLFPKDYLSLRLTGALATEASDASAGLLLAVGQRDWADEMLAAVGLSPDLFPALTPSDSVVGTLRRAAASELGLAAGIPVVAGGADQATGALGSGLLRPGTLLATLGTGGQLVTLVERPLVDPSLRIHTFCHAFSGQWYLLGATLAAGLAFRWLRDGVLRESGPDAYGRMTGWAAEVAPGAEGLLFLPYLTGEREASGGGVPRGAFRGLSLRHDHRHLTRAVMEGILYAMRRKLDVFGELGVAPQQIVAAGGGARSALWRQMMADIFGVPVRPLAVAEQSALGALLLAGLGVGIYRDAAEAAAYFVRYGAEVAPGDAVARYRRGYERFADAAAAESDDVDAHQAKS